MTTNSLLMYLTGEIDENQSLSVAEIEKLLCSHKIKLYNTSLSIDLLSSPIKSLQLHLITSTSNGLDCKSVSSMYG